MLLSLQDELKGHYHHTLRLLNPIPWSDVAQVSLDEVYTALEVVRGGINRRAFQPARIHRQLVPPFALVYNTSLVYKEIYCLLFHLRICSQLKFVHNAPIFVAISVQS